MSPCPPVLVLLFNRPALSEPLAAALRPARPGRLYVAADGPRPGRAGDFEACAEARRRLLAAIDWPCQVQTLLRGQNLGCAHAVHGALSWFFEQEAEGIVIEDDCVPSPAFFRYCEELLERYRNDTRVFAVSGDNFVADQTPAVPSYWFTRVFHVWGWATWQDRWKGVPLTIEAPDRATVYKNLRAAGLPRVEAAYWAPLFDRVRTGTPSAERIDSWAYPAAYHVFTHGQLCACPARNLVTNVGFGADSTHFVGEQPADKRVAAASLDFPLAHPARVVTDRRLHRLNMRRHFDVSLLRYLKHRVKAALRGARA